MTTYFAVIDKDADSAYGVWFPDLPGCFSASDEMEGIHSNALEALSLYAEDSSMPKPKSLEDVREIAKEDIAAGAFIMGIPYVSLTGRTVRANITMDAGLLQGIDEVAKSRGLTRSAFLAQAAREQIYGSSFAEKTESFEHEKQKN